MIEADKDYAFAVSKVTGRWPNMNAGTTRMMARQFIYGMSGGTEIDLALTAKQLDRVSPVVRGMLKEAFEMGCESPGQPNIILPAPLQSQQHRV